MKNINLAICVFLSLFGVNQALSLDLDKLTTKSGEVFYQIQVISSDKNGLLFRHSQGASKVDFSDLSANVRDLFEPVAEISAPPKLKSYQATSKAGSGQAKVSEQDLVLTVVVRRYLPQQQNHCLQQLSRRYPAVHTLPSYGRRFDRVHLLQNPYYRAQANLNFLRFNGLIPSSCRSHGQILANHRFY